MWIPRPGEGKNHHLCSPQRLITPPRHLQVCHTRLQLPIALLPKGRQLDTLTCHPTVPDLVMRQVSPIPCRRQDCRRCHTSKVIRGINSHHHHQVTTRMVGHNRKVTHPKVMVDTRPRDIQDSLLDPERLTVVIMPLLKIQECDRSRTMIHPWVEWNRVSQHTMGDNLATLRAATVDNRCPLGTTQGSRITKVMAADKQWLVELHAMCYDDIICL